MTRFWLTFEEAVKIIMDSLQIMRGGEVFVSKNISSMKILDLFKTLLPDIERETIGIRPGEKIHETLLTKPEASHSVELKDYYVILPQIETNRNYADYYISIEKGGLGGKKIPDDFSLTSDTNKKWMKPEEIKEIIYGK